MKNVIYGVAIMLLGVIVVTTILTITGVMNREIEIEDALQEAVENSVEACTSRHDYSLDNLSHFKGDITSDDDAQRVVNEVINMYKRIDILVNNAGSGIYGPIEETKMADAKKQINVSFYGAYNMAKCVIPYMR